MLVNLKDEMNIIQGEIHGFNLTNFVSGHIPQTWDGSSSWVLKHDWVVMVWTPMEEHDLLDNDINRMS